MKKYSLFLFLWGLLVLAGCDRTDMPSPGVQAQYLVEKTSLGTYEKDQTGALLNTVYPGGAALVQYGLEAYRVKYRATNYDGKVVEASGLVLLPRNVAGQVAMVSIQHGTILNDADAPSYFVQNNRPNANATLGILMASQGYVAVMPDYIGYGLSNNVEHPYEHRNTLAGSSLEMLRAVRELLKKEHPALWNDKLYVTGYSEGGLAGMGLLKKLQEEAPGEFNVRGGSLGAGPYNSTATMQYIINENSGGNGLQNAFYLWTLLTYDRIYGLNRPMNQYFREPYASQIQAKRQNTPISVNFGDIIADTFKAGLRNGTDTGFINAVKDNDVYDWKPMMPLRLYHGTDDRLVPIINSRTAYEAMQKRGAPSVQLIELQGKDHNTAVTAYLTGTLEMLQTVK